MTSFDTNDDNKPDQLVVFDVDGTLIQSIGIDDRCFTQAVADVLGVPNISTDWASYEYQTDAGLVCQIIREQLEAAPDELLATRVRNRFLDLLNQESNGADFVLPEVPGAAALLRHLTDHPNWCVAIATGGWEKPAKLKLEAAGLSIDDIPLASSDDAIPREQIIECAVRRAGAQYQQSEFRKIVYVGDGSWDVLAAQRLNIGFVGMQATPSAAEFDDSIAVVEHFTEPPDFIRLLNSVATDNR